MYLMTDHLATDIASLVTWLDDALPARAVA